MNETLITTLALTLLKGIGPAFIRKIGSLREGAHYEETSVNNDMIESRILSILEQSGKKDLKPDLSDAVARAFKIVYACRESSISAVVLGNAAYPSKLAHIKNPPPVVYLRGNQSLLSEDVVAIIGSRKATDEALAIASKVSESYQAKGFSVCNGLAAGVDTFAVRREGGVSAVVGVLGSGLSDSDIHQLPSSYRANAKLLIESGAGLLVSTCHPGAKQSTFTSIDACKYQAALSDAVILIESSETGGSRFTIEAAIELSRPIGVVWRSTWDESDDRRSLNAMLIKQGGRKGLLQTVNALSQSCLTVLESSASYSQLDAVIESERHQNPMGL